MIPADIIRFADPIGDVLIGTLAEGSVASGRLAISVTRPAHMDGEEVGFELGTDGRWYEVNDSQTPWTLLPTLGGCR